MILYGSKLVKKIRFEFENAKNRIWIAVPFIGHWKAIKQIMGIKWIYNENIDMKILTDINNENFINKETFQKFLHRCEVKTLLGLHAKIYIIDDSVFITSANLTETAFSKRYEICYFYKIESHNEIQELFIDWWEKGNNVELDWTPSINHRPNTEDEDVGNVIRLTKIWELPQESGDKKNIIDEKQNNTENYIINTDIVFYNFSNPIFDTQELKNQTNLIRLLLLRNETDRKIKHLLAAYYKKTDDWAEKRYYTYQYNTVNGYGYRGTGKRKDGTQGRPDPQLEKLMNVYNF